MVTDNGLNRLYTQSFNLLQNIACIIAIGVARACVCSEELSVFAIEQS